MSALQPARVLTRPGDCKYRACGRLWQGIPSMERTPGGWNYVTFYSGMKTEENGNFVILNRGRDEWPKERWEDALVVVEHEDPNVRCFDPCLWMDPLGRLWLTWTQSCGISDGRMGVWVIVTENPDDETPVWTAPRRIANGLMMNKPTVTKDGVWLFPTAVWSHDFYAPLEDHPEMAGEIGSNLYVTRDQGQTFSFLGGCDVPNRGFDEHMVVELNDGRLWMLVRAQFGVGESYSEDGGKTWSPGQESGIDGPNSRFFIRRLRSGRLLMVNHLNFRYGDRWDKGYAHRSNLIAQLSEDDGKSWIGALVLDTRREISYPDGVEDESGLIRIVYDRGRYKEREILMAAFREEDILNGALQSSDGCLRKIISVATGTED